MTGFTFQWQLGTEYMDLTGLRVQGPQLSSFFLGSQIIILSDGLHIKYNKIYSREMNNSHVSWKSAFTFPIEDLNMRNIFFYI